MGLAAFLAVASVRVILDGRSNFERAQRHERAGETDLAFAAMEDTARSYIPGSPYPSRALSKMMIMARGAEMRGNLQDARRAWESVRRSVLATRHVYIPNLDTLERAEQELERLTTLGDDKDEQAQGSAIVRRPSDPSPLASLFLFAGLVMWLGGSAIVFLLAPRSAGASTRRRVYGWLICLVGLGMWIAMSWLAG